MLGFNVKVLEDAQKEAQDRGVNIFNEQIIYNLVQATDWVAYQREHEELIMFNELRLYANSSSSKDSFLGAMTPLSLALRFR